MGSLKEPILLAIDTSCDETSVSVLKGRRVLAHIVSSQVELHKKWGGVVPDIARRAHEEELPGAIQEAMKRAAVDKADFDGVAVTIGPGLAIDLEVGIDAAKKLAAELDIPFIPVNHMEGHFLSALALNSEGKGRWEDSAEELFPALGVLVSGKHTEIVYSEKIGQYTKLGKTLDDAAGEAFDKVGRMLNFGYPGGPVISEFALEAKGKEEFGLPVPMAKSDDLNMSYSGLKTACLYKVKELREAGRQDPDWVHDFCAEFVDVVIESISIKLRKAIKLKPEVKSIFIGGGVVKNEKLARRIGMIAREFELDYLLPEIKYRSDNASMIGIAGLFQFYRGDYLTDSAEIEKVDRIPRYEIDHSRGTHSPTIL